MQTLNLMSPTCEMVFGSIVEYTIASRTKTNFVVRLNKF